MADKGFYKKLIDENPELLKAGPGFYEKLEELRKERAGKRHEWTQERLKEVVEEAERQQAVENLSTQRILEREEIIEEPRAVPGSLEAWKAERAKGPYLIEEPGKWDERAWLYGGKERFPTADVLSERVAKEAWNQRLQQEAEDYAETQTKIIGEDFSQKVEDLFRRSGEMYRPIKVPTGEQLDELRLQREMEMLQEQAPVEEAINKERLARIRARQSRIMPRAAGNIPLRDIGGRVKELELEDELRMLKEQAALTPIEEE